ncbi:MAG: glycyl-tRNA synthetase beta chain [Cocleimonas sp.]|jgi:glycyl-tRNA synthetase beta chain
MSVTKDLLIEIGTEELPPKALKKLSDAFTSGVVAGLKDASLEASEVISYAAPRRLAMLLKGVPAKQADQSVERKGPAKAAAFDGEGNPTKAVEGFARSCGVSAFDLEEIETPKGIWLVFRQDIAGKDTAELVPEIVSKSLAKLPIPKRMRWGASDIEFVRPVHWILMMLDDQVIDGEILGVKSGNITKGHRFHHPEVITIKTASAYAEQLHQEGHVIADFEARRAEVRRQAENAAKELGGIAQIDTSLLDEVTALIELPIAVSGSFDKEFLQVPQECLITSMQDHQKYFPVVDSDNKLMPYFITTSNIKSSNPVAVSQGNERVIRPRFADAKFFWDQDCKVKLESHREATKKIVFQQKLGTLFEKTERVSILAGFIADEVGANNLQAMRAAEISKCDLLSNMVQEFPELQGIMGSYYAKHDNETEAVAAAMQEQYQPGFAGDVIPTGQIGKILSLADRLDTIMGIFAIDMKPTGSKDPFSLRRAALGALRIIIEGDLNLDLKALLVQAADGLQQKVDASAAVEDAFAFIMERLKAYYQDQGINSDTVNSVASLSPTQPLDFDQRVKAVADFRSLTESEFLAAANKRISNILKKVEGEIPNQVNQDLLNEDAEKILYQAVVALQEKVRPLYAKGEYSTALSSLAVLREDVDNFFDNIMVMDENEALRNNRLALLSQLRGLFLEVADLSRL